MSDSHAAALPPHAQLVQMGTAHWMSHVLYVAAKLNLADHLAKEAKKAGISVLGIEGEASGEWVLIDLGEVIAHVMQEESRSFYQLEKLWSV